MPKLLDEGARDDHEDIYDVLVECMPGCDELVQVQKGLFLRVKCGTCLVKILAIIHQSYLGAVKALAKMRQASSAPQKVP